MVKFDVPFSDLTPTLLFEEQLLIFITWCGHIFVCYGVRAVNFNKMLLWWIWYFTVWSKKYIKYIIDICCTTKSYSWVKEWIKLNMIAV